MLTLKYKVKVYVKTQDNYNCAELWVHKLYIVKSSKVVSPHFTASSCETSEQTRQITRCHNSGYGHVQSSLRLNFRCEKIYHKTNKQFNTYVSAY
jgi:hypothetical protein